MPRLFTAVELPEELKLRLSLMRSGLPGAHFVDPSNYHLTTRFAGDISDRAANAFADALMDIPFHSFELEICGLGSFGGHKPRAVWASLKPSLALDLLQKAHERAARMAGLPPEPRKFSPHITLARLRGTRPEMVAAYLAQHGAFSCAPFTVSGFVLFSSRPKYGGGPYVVEESYQSINAGYEEEDDWAVA